MSREPQNKNAKAVRKLSIQRADNIICFPKAHVMSTNPDRLNNRELCSIKAMTAYVAHNQNVREETVNAFVEAEFNVDDITQLRRDDFDRVIAYLVDLQCDLMTN